MFNFFKRSKVEQWEKTLLQNILSELPPEFIRLRSQVEEGVLRAVSFNTKVIPNYTGFRYNPEIAARYRDERKASYTIKKLKVYDNLSQTYINFEIVVVSEIVAGYATPDHKKVKLSIDKFDTSDYFIKKFGQQDFDEISSLLSKETLAIIQPGDVYQVELDNKIYYHIKDLDDGDFIAIDNKGNVFELSHDPYEIKRVYTPLADYLIATTKNNRLVGRWRSDPAHYDTQINFGDTTMDFRENGELIYIIKTAEREQTVNLLYSIQGDQLITDQPSHPDRQSTLFNIEEDTLLLTYDGFTARYIRINN
jgi:hypothetical protein